MEFSNTPSQLIFPILKSSEILECMAELDVELSKAELSEPQRHRDKLRKVFLKLLEICRGTIESDLEASKNALDKAASMPHSDLHEVSSDIKLFRLLHKLFHTCGIYDFSLKDLHSPTAKRLRWQLSAIINLAKFREDQLMVYADLNEPRNEFLLALDDVNNEHEQLKVQLEAGQVVSDENYVKMEEVAKECEELTAQIAHSNKLQASKREEAATLKRSANDLKDELATATWALEEVDAEEERMRSQVVSSPDRRQNELNAKREALDQERDECERLEDEVQDTKTKCHHVEEAKKAMEAEIVTVLEVKEEAGKYADAVQQLETVSREVEANQKLVGQVTEEMGLCERDLNRTEDKLSNLQKQGKMKLEAAQQSLDAAKSQMLMVEQGRRDGMQRVETGELRVREIEAQIEEERLQTQGDIEGMIAEFRETEELVITRLNKRMEAMEVGKENDRTI